MPLSKFILKPGVNKEVTDFAAQGQWVDSDNVRFFNGLPEKIKGWEKFSSTTLVGVVRAQHAWRDLDGDRYDALGTDRKLYIYFQGVNYDITPIRRGPTALTDPFTTNATTTVQVTDNGHGATTGDFVTFDSFTTIDGLDMNNEFEVTSVIDTDNYTVTHTSTASGSTAGGGGSGNANYQINIGVEFSTFGYGWGTDGYGLGAWGSPSSISDVTLEARQWSLDNYGQNLIATVKNGGTYQWSPSSGVATRAAVVANAPTTSRFSLVSTPDRHLVLFGTEDTIGTPSTQDELLIRFSDQENITEYTPRAENTAGSLRIADGSKILAGKRSRGQILVWTDTSLHSLQYIGPPFTFGLRQLGQNCGIVGQFGAIDLNGISYWMSQDSFYLFDGAVRKLPCTVNTFVFNNINLTASQNTWCTHNGEFNEVTWFYARTGSDQINACVTYNYLEQTWWTGTLTRTTWLDREVFDNPIATEYDPTATANVSTIYGLTNGASTVYIHEVGNSADGQPIAAYVQSGANPIGEGDEFAFVKKVIPDFQNQQGTVYLDFEFKRYPNDANVVTKTTSFTSTTEKVDLRGRGRQFVANVYSNTAGTSWRLGAIRFDVQPDGMR